MTSYFLDANILLRHLLGDHPNHTPQANNIFFTISSGNIHANITTLVLHEVTYVLEKVYRHKRSDIAASLSLLLELNNFNVIDIDKKSVIQALEDYRTTKVDFPDCIYKQICIGHNLKLISFDHHFNQINFPTSDKV